MDAHAPGTGRQPAKIGMLPVLTLVAILGFATLAVLAVTTSHAMGAIAQRQATSTTDAYLLEEVGQRYVAAIDDALETGAAPDFSALASTAASQADPGISATADLDGDTVKATFSTTSGRQLAIELTLGSSSSRIRSWKLTGVQADGTEETLWDNTDDTDSTTATDTANE